ncbi:MAG: hypothetical protein MUF75_03280 [Bacteroidia bacterium]|jgi:hypothetical protein|nr:hypothetical protein [Bacteroidia bacterium]
MEKLEKLLEVIKSMFIVLFYSTIVIVLIYNYKVVVDKIQEFAVNAKIESVDLGLVQLVAEQKKTIEKVLNEASPHAGKVDTLANETQKLLLKSLATTNQKLKEYENVPTLGKAIEKAQEKWLYVGSYSVANKRWTKKYIAFEAKLEVGSTGKSLTPVNVRDSSPKYTDQEGWIMGRVVDGIDQDVKLEVLEVKVVPGTNNQELYWIRVN